MRENQIVTIEIPPEGPRAQYASRVEALDNEGIVLAAPLEGNEVVPLFTGQRLAVVVAYGRSGEARRFITTVLWQRSHPLPLIKVARPERIERVQRRRFFREDVLLRGFCRRSTQIEPPVAMVTRNLSGGGALVRVRLRGGPEWLRQLQRGGHLWLELHLASGLPLESLARIVRLHLEVEAVDLALEFENLPELERERLIKYLFRLQREALRKGLLP
jgi:c-di-GMP-binding flagellar brake protein YcgR